MCEEKGQQFDRVKMLELSAEDAEKKDLKKQRKKNPDEGFSSKIDINKEKLSNLGRLN